MKLSEHVVGLRELRHNTSGVLARVRQGETIDITAYGRLVARIIPVADRSPAPALDRLIKAGRLRSAERPGYRPLMRVTEGTDLLGDALAADRDDECR